MQRVMSKPLIGTQDSNSGRASPPKPKPKTHEEPAVQFSRNFAPAAFRGQLNMTPSFWLFFASMVWGVITSAFLELYVTTASSHLCVFFVGSYCVFSSYFVCDYVMAPS